MSGPWTVVHFKAFYTPLTAHQLRCREELAAKTAREVELEQVLKRFNDVKAFIAAAACIKTARLPPQHLKAAQDDHGVLIPNYYCARVGSWTGYYLIDHEAKLCTGVLTRVDTDPPEASIATVLASIVASEGKGK